MGVLIRMVLRTYGRQVTAQRQRRCSNEVIGNALSNAAVVSPGSPSAKETAFIPSTPTSGDARQNGLLSTPKSTESKVSLSPSQANVFSMVPESPTRLKKKRNLVRSLEPSDSGRSHISSAFSESIFSPKKQRHSLDDIPMPPSVSVVPNRDHSTRSMKNTYSGQRSYVADLNGQSSYRDSRQLTEDEITNDIMSRPTSIHDMREAGENRRFLDETEYILLGLQSSSPNLHITSLIEISSYFQDPFKLRRLKINNLVATILARAESSQLMGISDLITLILLHYVVRSGSCDASIPELVHVRRVILKGFISVESEAIKELSDYKSKAMTRLCRESVRF